MRVEDICSYILYYDAKIDIFFILTALLAD